MIVVRHQFCFFLQDIFVRTFRYFVQNFSLIRLGCQKSIANCMAYFWQTIRAGILVSVEGMAETTCRNTDPNSIDHTKRRMRWIKCSLKLPNCEKRSEERRVGKECRS